MSFTDEDLKQLKEQTEEAVEKSWNYPHWSKIQALLARLEASEQVVKRALQYKHHFHGNCLCDNCKPVTAWRKVRGNGL